MAGVVIGRGLFVRARRALVQSLRAGAGGAGDEARAAERRRIAREMHDVLAHRLSLLSVHAGALEFRPDARLRRSPSPISPRSSRSRARRGCGSPRRSSWARRHRRPRPGELRDRPALHLSVPTVKAHVSRLLDKLDVDNRVQIALLVQAAGER